MAYFFAVLLHPALATILMFPFRD